MSKKEQKIYQFLGQAVAIILFTTPFALMFTYGLIHATTLN